MGIFIYRAYAPIPLNDTSDFIPGNGPNGTKLPALTVYANVPPKDEFECDPRKEFKAGIPTKSPQEHSDVREWWDYLSHNATVDLDEITLVISEITGLSPDDIHVYVPDRHY